jgi:DeoR/GlpR family transcriptional regulator of sugar metabolism
MNMKKKIRQEEILSILRAMQTEVQVDKLARMLEVSTLTIRRDLKELAEERAIIRTSGGCILGGRVAQESEYHKKVASNFELKSKIGKRAAQLVNPGDVIFIDDGSTTFHLAVNLLHISSLTIYTNSLVLVPELSRYSNISLNILGGEVNSHSYSVSGSITETILDNIRFDKVFMGADAVDKSGKCFVKDTRYLRITQMLMRSGEEKICFVSLDRIETLNFIANRVARKR